MTLDRNKPTLNFVNLHGHTTFSPFDGFGYPLAHMTTAYDSGMDALAITDHGNMNALSFQVQAADKMKKDGHVRIENM
jgi:DNA polymerase III alpha subunit